MRGRPDKVARMLGSPDALATPWGDLRFRHVAAATVNTILAALKGVARAACDLGLLSGDDHERIRSAKPVRGAGPEHRAHSLPGDAGQSRSGAVPGTALAAGR
jgi:hypothetical protein